ncbi:MAG: NUDIX domain-containing protein [Bacteroidetes bacterium]|nr:NUDIX domain-containing protein [Bacteroidota bacterium]
MTPSHFNIRVYGLWFHAACLLVNEEIIRGQSIIKFPGGGLELGEGAVEGLKREWREELGLEIDVLSHFYTTDFFQRSAWDDSQVVSIYYFVQADARQAFQNQQADEHSFWMPQAELREDRFTLPIDRLVARMLAEGKRF